MYLTWTARGEGECECGCECVTVYVRPRACLCLRVYVYVGGAVCGPGGGWVRECVRACARAGAWKDGRGSPTEVVLL